MDMLLWCLLQPLPTAQERTRLTLFVPCKNPDLNISQGEDGDGLRDTFLQLVLNSCGPQELDTEQSGACLTVKKKKKKHVADR